MMYPDYTHKLSAISGMTLILIVRFHQEEIIKTFLLAGIGGISSYLFTMGLKILIEYVKNKLKR